MAARNEIDPTIYNGPFSPQSLRIYFGQLAGGATIQDTVETFKAATQWAVYGIVITNVDASNDSNTIVTSGNTQMFPAFLGGPGEALVALSPDGVTPLCITETNRELKVACVGAGSAAVDILLLYREVM